jgi:peptide/nickel transport system substrate-binding protein
VDGALHRARRAVAAVAVALLATTALAVAGCGASKSSSGGSSASPGTAQLTSFVGKAAGDVESMTWGLPYGEPDTLDPRNAAWYSSALIVANTCDFVLQMKENGEVGPGLATSWTQPDPKTMVYTIREGVKFWDGNPLTAEDVAYSLNRSAAPESVVGFFFTDVASIKATGMYEVTIRFKKPDELLHRELATFVGAVIEKKWAEKTGAAVGTAKGGLMASGPFKLDKWTAGQGIELSRNDAYWNDAYRAHAAKVSLKFVPDSTALSQALTSGELDGAYEVPTAIIPSLRNSSAGTLHFGPSRQYYAIEVLRPDGPLADTNLRKALYLATNRPAVAEKVFNGAGKADYTWLATSTWDPGALNLWRADYQSYVKENAYNLAAAKKLVADSSYSGAPITIIIPAGDTTSAEMAQLLQQSGKDIGLNVVIKPLQSIQYNQAMVSADARKGYDLLMSSSFNAVTDPLEPLGFEILPGSFYNYVNYNDPQVTALVTKARQTFDPVARSKMLIEAQRRYEAQSIGTTFVELFEVSFLNNRLSGMITSFNYMFLPSLATIGSAK